MWLIGCLSEDGFVGAHTNRMALLPFMDLKKEKTKELHFKFYKLATTSPLPNKIHLWIFMKQQKPWWKPVHCVKWQETLPPFNRGGPSLISAALFVSQWAGEAYEWVALWDKARKRFVFGMPPAGSRWALAWKEVAEVPGRSPGSEIWFGCRVTLVAPVSRNKCSVPGQRTQVMPSLWDSFEELAGCWDCRHALALTSLGVSLHDCSQEGSGETRSCCCDLARPHGQ